MLDDYHRVAAVNQLLQYLHQNLYILEVQTRCRLIEYVQCLSCVAFAQFGG